MLAGSGQKLTERMFFCLRINVWRKKLTTIFGICQPIQFFCEVVFINTKNLKNTSSNPLLLSSALVFSVFSSFNFLHPNRNDMTTAIPQLASKTETPNSNRGNFEGETLQYFFPQSHFGEQIDLIDDGARSFDYDFEKLGDFNQFF